MKAKFYLTEMASVAMRSTAAGIIVGLLWGAGILDLIPRRHSVRHSSSYSHGMTISRFEANILWYPIYGAAAGIVAGGIVGFFSARAALARNDKSSKPDDQTA